MNRRKTFTVLGIAAGILVVGLGVFASNGWLPKTDPMTGKKTGWFGRELPKHATSSWNLFPPPSPTPQLSKEYIYAGSRLLAVEDANATAAPPADIAVWRGSSGTWMVMGQTGSQAVNFQWGGGWLNDVPLVGDYDGDGKTDFTVYREGATTGAASYFYVWPSSPINWWGDAWGIFGDKATAGDFDGDGRTDYAIVRQESGSLNWWITTSSNSSYYSIVWGTSSHKAAPADYDGDGIADVATYDSTNKAFYIRNSDNSTISEAYFPYDGTVVSSDYDGDGKADPAIYVPSTATWYVHQSTTKSIVSSVWGNNGSSGCTGSCSGLGLVPVHNDYDLDGKTDLAVWTPATNAVWTIKRSSNNTTRTETFGMTGDIPVPAFYRR